MSSSILKAGFIQFNMDETRIINSNELVENILHPQQGEASPQEEEGGVRAWKGTDFGAQDGPTDESLDGLITDEEELQAGADGLFTEGEEEQFGEEPYGGGEQEPASFASAEIEEMKAQAMEEIEQMKEAAMAEIEEMKAQIFEDARIEGRDAGYQQGYEEGRSQAEEELNAKQAQLDAAMERYNVDVADMEPQIVEKLTGIYEHVFHVDLSENREIILHLLDKAIHGIDTGQSVTIRASREDYPYINMQKKRFLAGISNNVTVEVVEDSSLKQNECLIETDNGVFDCSVDVELHALSKTLQLLSYEG